MSLQPKAYLTPEDYLAIERSAEFKSEYFAGEMFAMLTTTHRRGKT
jgi:Uma2 family endonuclease